MFSLLFKNRHVDSSSLLESSLYDESRFYRAFVKDLKNARNEVIIESPYLTRKRAKDFTPVLRKLLKRGVVVHVHTRNPNHHDENLRAQGWASFYHLKSLGVKVKLHNNLPHRKVAIIDGLVLWEGSLNILSQCNSREIMRRTESEALCTQMVKFTGIKKRLW